MQKRLKQMLFALLVYVLVLGNALPHAHAAEMSTEAAAIAALPSLEQIRAMSMEKQLEAYYQVQEAYDAYESLTDAQKAQIPDAENTFAVLFAYFNSLVAPAAIHSHPICGHAGCADGHSAMSWTAWNGTSSIGNSNYYLTQDVTRTGYYTITGSVRICLNGHTLSTNGEAPGFRIAKGGSLVITDCQGTGMICSDANEPHTISSTEIGIENSGGLVLWNGTINGNWNGILSNGGYVNIRGGSVQSRLSGAISLENGTSFSMSNGSVEGEDYGISDYDDNSSVSISGGTITGTFGALDMQSPVDINGGTFGGTVCGRQLYLSGAPKLDSVWAYSALSLQNKSGTASYTGSGFRLRSSVGNGNVAVTNVPNTGIADKITVYDGVNTGLLAGKLVASGTNLVLYTPVASGQVGNLQWRLYDDGELLLMGSGAMPDYRDTSSYPWYSYRSSIRSLTVSDGVTHIGSNAFLGSTLQSVSFGSASLSLGDHSFAYCNSLTEIDFGSGTISPGENVFMDCDALTSVHVPKNVVMNGNYSGIGSGYDMFHLCRNLQTATVDCDYVGPYFFEGCTAITQVAFTNKDVNFYYLEENIGHPFNAGPEPVYVTVVGHLCSKANVLVQKSESRYYDNLTFQQIPGDTTQHTEQILPGTATCTQDGLSEGKICATCGLVLVKQQPVAALGHIEVIDEAVEATCTETGLTEGKHCSVCNEILLAQEVIPALGHTEIIDEAMKPTCTETGLTEGKHCSVCGEILLAQKNVPAAHHFENNVCTVCGFGQGTCGENLTWTLEDGVLTISGTGGMEDYGFAGYNYTPWFEEQANITSVVLKEGVTSIGNNAFLECGNLTTVSIPEGVTSIGELAFCSCFSLNSVTIPESVTSIGGGAFSCCNSLSSIIIPQNVSSIGDGVFEQCTSLAAITVSEKNECYCSIDGVLFDKDCTKLLVVPCSKKGSYSIPEGVTSIGRSAFSFCNELTSITIPEGVTSIGEDAFYHCSGLTDITIPEGVNSIGSWAFFGCSSLVSITIPEGVTFLESYVFCNCSSLKSISLPKGVSSIESYAFSDCKELTNITIPEQVISIESFAFSDCSSLTEITLPQRLTSIGSSAFSECTNLTTIRYGGTKADWDAIRIGSRNDCLTNATIVYANPSAQMKLSLPKGTTIVEDSAFADCVTLESVLIPESVTRIGTLAFDGCDRLYVIAFSGSAPAIAVNAFAGVTATVYYPVNDPSWTDAVLQNYGGTLTWVPYSVN